MDVALYPLALSLLVLFYVEIRLSMLKGRPLAHRVTRFFGDVRESVMARCEKLTRDAIFAHLEQAERCVKTMKETSIEVAASCRSTEKLAIEALRSAGEAKSEVLAMKNSSHKVQYVPLNELPSSRPSAEEIEKKLIAFEKAINLSANAVTPEEMEI